MRSSLNASISLSTPSPVASRYTTRHTAPWLRGLLMVDDAAIDYFIHSVTCWSTPCDPSDVGAMIFFWCGGPRGRPRHVGLINSSTHAMMRSSNGTERTHRRIEATVCWCLGQAKGIKKRYGRAARAKALATCPLLALSPHLAVISLLGPGFFDLCLGNPPGSVRAKL